MVKIDEIIRLFKAVPIFSDKKKENTEEILKRTIKNGYILSPEVLGNYDDVDAIIKLVENEIGLSADQMNSSFHKSWGKVKDAPMMQLILEQVIHYITTYGFQELGVYDDSTIYIPKEKLELPEIELDKIQLTLIRGYTYEEIKEKLLGLLDSGIALKEDTSKDIMAVFKLLEAENIKFTIDDLSNVKNKEVSVMLMDELGLVPENPTEFLRFIVFKITGSALLIKNPATIEKIKVAEQGLENYFLKYKLEYGLEKLSSIFLRYKPLFLAMKKSTPVMKSYINKLRKLAVEHHKPMKEDYLNSITKNIKHNIPIEMSVLLKELKKVNTFRKIRLAYALKFRTKDSQSIMYRIRNGKSYATTFDDFHKKDNVKSVLAMVKDSIVLDLAKNVSGKKIYIPDYITYSLPSSEKQFTGNFPSGTFIESEKDILVGIWWKNLVSKTIDLDLSLIDDDGKIGWDSGYRNEERNILFSGDMTSAPLPKGATELFYIKKQTKSDHLMLVNYYNWSEAEVPFKIMIGEESPKDFNSNYMINPNNVKATAQATIKDKQMILGLVETLLTKNRFYFVETSIGKSITSRGNNFVDNARNYLFDFYKNMISLNDLIKQAGAILVDKIEDAEIDLSPENIEKDTIINLLK